MQLIRVGAHIINVERVSVAERIGDTLHVMLMEEDATHLGDMVGTSPLTFTFTGIEADAIQWYLDTLAVDVVAQFEVARDARANRAAFRQAGGEAAKKQGKCTTCGAPLESANTLCPECWVDAVRRVNQ